MAKGSGVSSLPRPVVHGSLRRIGTKGAELVASVFGAGFAEFRPPSLSDPVVKVRRLERSGSILWNENAWVKVDGFASKRAGWGFFGHPNIITKYFVRILSGRHYVYARVQTLFKCRCKDAAEEAELILSDPKTFRKKVAEWASSERAALGGQSTGLLSQSAVPKAPPEGERKTTESGTSLRQLLARAVGVIEALSSRLVAARQESVNSSKVQLEEVGHLNGKPGMKPASERGTASTEKAVNAIKQEAVGMYNRVSAFLALEQTIKSTLSWRAMRELETYLTNMWNLVGKQRRESDRSFFMDLRIVTETDWHPNPQYCRARTRLVHAESDDGVFGSFF